MLQAIALAFGLAMDATAVCAARAIGAGAKRRAAGEAARAAAHYDRELVILPLVFGAFQAGMASLGWLGGTWATRYIAAWDHWVAFGLLVVIGGKTIIDAWRGETAEPRPGSVLLYLGLGVATSIDAAAAGLTLPLLGVAPWLALVLIGTVTAGCSALGYAAGRLLGQRIGPRLGLLGGLVLIAIGIDILIRAP